MKQIRFSYAKYIKLTGIILLIMFTCQANAEEKSERLEVSYDKGLLSVKADNVSFKRLWDEITDKAKIEVEILDKELEDLKVTIEFKDLNIEGSLKKILFATGIKNLIGLGFPSADEANNKEKNSEIKKIEIGKRNTINKWVVKETLKKKDKNERNLFIYSLADTWIDETKAILEELIKNDGDVDIRMMAILSYGSRGREEAIPVLKEVLLDKDKRVQLTASYALGKIGNDSGYDLAKEALKDGEAVNREYAVMALGEIGKKESLDLIKEAQEDKDEHVRISAKIAEKEMQLKETEDKIKYLQEILEKNSEYKIQFWAAVKLATECGEEGMNIVKRIKEDTNNKANDATAAVLNTISILKRENLSDTASIKSETVSKEEGIKDSPQKKSITIKYQNGMLKADITGVTIKEIFDELKKQASINYEIEKEILEQKVTISFKEKELSDGIKDILNTIGNPSYMMSYRKDKNGKYEVSSINISKRGKEDLLTVSSMGGFAKKELKPGEIEIGFVNGKYRVRAKEADVNELLERLSGMSGIYDEIVTDNVDKKIDFEGEDDMLITLIDDIFRGIRPKIFEVIRIVNERDQKGNILKHGYIKIKKMSDEEIRKRREYAQLKNTEGERLIKEGRYLEAISSLEDSAGTDKDYFPPCINLANIYLTTREYSKAIDYFKRVVEVDMNNVDAYLGLGEAYEKTNQREKALENMERYVSLEKDEKKIQKIKEKIDSLKKEDIVNYYSLLKKADEYKNKGDIVKAKEEYENAIKIQPELSSAYEKLALLYEKTQDYPKAKEMYNKAIEKDKSNYELYLRLATMEVNTGKMKEAIGLMSKAIEVCPVKDTVLRINQMIEMLKEKIKDGK